MDRRRWGLRALVGAAVLAVIGTVQAGPGFERSSDAAVVDAAFATSLGLPAGTPIEPVACAPVANRCTGSIQAAVDRVPAGTTAIVRVGPGVYFESVLVAGKSVHLVGDGGTVWIDGLGQGWPADGKRHGVVFDTAGGSSLRRIAVRRFTLADHDNFRAAVKVMKSPGVLISEVTSVDNSYEGIGLGESPDVVIERVIVRRNDAIGIGAWLSNNLVIRDSFIAENTDTGRYQAEAEQYRESAGIKTTESGNVTITRNTVQANGSTGIWTDVGTHDSVISYNQVDNNLWHGIETEISQRILVHHNTVLANADGQSPFPSPRHGILVLDSNDISVVANIVRHRKGDIELGWSQAVRLAETPSRPVHPRIGQPQTDTWGVVLDGNTIEELSSSGSLLGFYDPAGARGATQMLASSNLNYFRRVNGTFVATESAGVSRVSWIGVGGDIAALTQWRTWRCAGAAVCREAGSVLQTI